MKKTIEIECPDGYKPIYNAETGNVEIVYVSTQFGKLVFDACFTKHFKGEEFEWLD